MKENQHAELILTSPPGVPCHFTISISKGKEINNPGFKFAIISHDSVAASKKTGVYKLKDTTHNSYLDLFEKLAADYNLRIPQNRKHTGSPTFKLKYREVLTKNIADGILYGYGDPAVIRVQQNNNSIYYLVSTSNDAPDSFPIIKSENLKDWKFVNFVFPRGRKPKWAADGERISDYWAPEMHKVGNEFRVYFVARDKHTHELCIGVARSLNPEGPFIADNEPILSGNVIDPHIFIQNNHTYLFWKEDNNDVWPGALIKLLYNYPYLIDQLFHDKHDQVTASFIITVWPWLQRLEPMERFLFVQVFIEAVISKYTVIYNLLKHWSDSKPSPISGDILLVLNFMKTTMFARELSANGSTFTGKSIKIIENDLEWEAHLVEGIWVTYHHHKYYLFYAGNDFSTDQYGIGVAIADSLLGPYVKMPKPLLQSTDRWLAPGHPSVTIAPDGKPILFLHAYFPGEAGYKKFRALLALPLRFESDRVIIAE